MSTVRDHTSTLRRATVPQVSRSQTLPCGRSESPARAALGLRDPDTFVYGLREAGGKFRYVGITTQPKTRLRQHRNARRRTDQRGLGLWLEELFARGAKPDLALLYLVPEGEDPKAAERDMITTLLRVGYDLVNGTGVTARKHCGLCGETGHYASTCSEAR